MAEGSSRQHKRTTAKGERWRTTADDKQWADEVGRADGGEGGRWWLLHPLETGEQAEHSTLSVTAVYSR